MRVRVLTVVGELHSLTDWHVSEASDDAELDDFFSRKTEKKMLTNAQTGQKSISTFSYKHKIQNSVG